LKSEKYVFIVAAVFVLSCARSMTGFMALLWVIPVAFKCWVMEAEMLAGLTRMPQCFKDKTPESQGVSAI
jgi:hypothetical protein